MTIRKRCHLRFGPKRNRCCNRPAGHIGRHMIAPTARDLLMWPEKP